MAYGLDFFLRQYSQYWTARLFSTLARAIMLHCLMLAALFGFLIIGLATVSGGILMAIIMVALVDLGRILLWLVQIGRSFWRRYRPPYRDKDFQFNLPNTPIDYHYEPNNSAARLPIGVLGTSLMIWIGFQYVIQKNLSIVVGFTKWLLMLIPQDSIRAAYYLFSLLFGLPTWDNLPSEEVFIDMFGMLLWVPQLFISFLLLWNLLYVFDVQISETYVDSNAHPAIKKDFKFWGLDDAIFYFKAIISGIVSGLGDFQGDFRRLILIPLLILAGILSLASMTGF